MAVIFILLLLLTNHGTIIDGLFVSAVSNESEGKIENGTFRSTVTNNGIIKGGIFQNNQQVALSLAAIP